MTYGGRVFIGGISANVSKDHIENEFGKFGKLRTVWIATRPPGFAFVEYDDNRDAEEAVKSLNGSNLFNENKIRVEISKKRPQGGGRNPRDSGIKSGGRSNPNFRSANTSFKPKNPRFLNSSSSNVRGGGSGGRSIRGGRFSDSSAPRFNNQLSGSRPGRQGGNQTQRFQNSRSSGGPNRGFGSSGSGRRPNNGGSSGGGFFSGGNSGGYKSNSNFRNRQNDN